MKESLTKEQIQTIVNFYQKMVDKHPDNATLKSSLQEWLKRSNKL